MEQPQPSIPSERVVDAIFKDGVIQPLSPLDLPDGTPLQLRLTAPVVAHVSLPATEAAPRGHTPPTAEGAAPHAPKRAPLDSVGEPAVFGPQIHADTELRYLPPLRIMLVFLALACAYAARSTAGNDALIPNPWLAVGAWLGGIGLAAAACYPRSPSGSGAATTDQAQPWTRPEFVAVAGLFVFALLARLLNIGSIPAALSGDEGSIGLTAADIVAGRFNNPFAIGWFSFPSLFFFVPALFMSWLGQNYEALRIPAAIIGACTVVAVYWLGRVLFDRTVALVGAALLAASHLHVHFSRVGLNNICDGLFGVLILGTFWRGWQTGRRMYFVATGILIGLSQYFYTSTRVVPLVLLAWLALILVTNWRSFVQRVPHLLCIVLMAVIAFLPLGLFFLEHPDDFGAPVSRVSLLHRREPDAPNWFEQASQETGTPVWRLVLNNYKTAALGFVSVPLQSWYSPGIPLLLALPAVLFVLGLLSLLLNIRNPRSWMLLLLLLGMMSISALTDSTPAAQRYVLAAPIATIVAGVGFSDVLRQTMQLWPKHRSVLYGFAAALLVIAMYGDLGFYFAVYTPKDGYGDPNTQVGTQLGTQLQSYEPGTQVFFFGLPRMGYRSASTVPFLAPQVEGTDVGNPLVSAPDWPLQKGTSMFVFLPERQDEAALVERQYPGGNGTWVNDFNNQPLYYVYKVQQ